MPAHRALHALSAAALVFAAACTDATSVAPPAAPGPDGPAAVRLACTADVAARTVQCAAPGATGNLRADRIYGQGAAMKLTSSNVAIVADSFTFDMTVTNLLEYPVGTTDGVNADPNGIRVFFVDGIHTTQGSGSVTVANADGVDVFTASGQAYFRYLGVLQPNATTAARKWKLRFDPGVERFSFGLYISTPVPPGGGTVALTILEPVADSAFADSVLVRARIDSASASIQSVRAFVADRSVTLAPYGVGLVKGVLPLAGLPFGPQQIRVHAVTVHADTGNAFVTIVHDAPPTLAVARPTANQVARPSLRIDADCTDDDPGGCVSVTASIGGDVLASGTTGIHADVSLGAYDEQQPTVRIDARDSRGHTRTVSVKVYVEASPALTFVDSAGFVAMDADSSRLLFADAANGVWLHDRPGGTRALLQAHPVDLLSGWLFPLGAIWGRRNTGQVYEWRNGVLTTIKAVTNTVQVKGSWALFTDGFDLYRRDLAAGTQAFIGSATDYDYSESDIAANGDVVQIRIGDVYRNRVGVGWTRVASGSYNRWPLTDGINVVYRRDTQLVLWNEGIDSVLGDAPAGAAPNTHYAVSGGWVAYVFTDGGGATQVRVRAPDGTDRQVTTFAGSSLIRALSAEGTLAFAYGGSVYVVRAPFTAAPARIGKDWFTVRFRGTELQLYLGNTVFRAAY
jgi:hypothetical protein